MIDIYTEDTYGVIYKVQNIVNNKIYIGKTKNSDGFNGRYRSCGIGIERIYNFSKIKGNIYNNHLIRSIEKYGFDSFVVDEIFDTAKSEEELNEKERYWVDFYKSNDCKFGYNKTTGGESCCWSYELRRDMLIKTGNPVICLNTNEVFLSIKDASIVTGIPHYTISKIANGENSKYDLKFKFLKFGRHQPMINVKTKMIYKNGQTISNLFGDGKSKGYIYYYKKNPYTKNIWEFNGESYKTYYNYIVENYKEIMENYKEG